MKKLISVILAVAMLVSVCSALIITANAADMTVVVESKTAKAGESVALSVSVQNNTGFSYLKFSLKASEAYTFKSAKKGDLIKAIDEETEEPIYGLTSTKLESGSVNISIEKKSGEDDCTDNGVLFTLTLDLAESATGTVTPDLTLADSSTYDEQTVALTVDAGAITIEAEAEAPKMINFWKDVFQCSSNVLSVQGWAGANYQANNLGYRVDGGDPIFDGIEFRDFNTPAEGDTIRSLAGENAFRFASVTDGIDLSGLEPGEHTITLVVRVTGPEGNAVLDMYSESVTIVQGVVPEPVLQMFSFDNVMVDGVQLVNGNAGAYIDNNPIIGDVQTLGARGWAWVAQGTIGVFGYQIDEQEPVLGAQFIQNRPDLQGSLGGVDMTHANGFNIENIDVSGLEDGYHTFKIYVKPSGDYAPLLVTSFRFKIERPVVYELKNVNYDGIYYDGNAVILPEGSMDKKVKDPANREKLDYEEGSVSTISFRGWVRISENEADIAAYGYSIDGAAPVYGEFFEDRGTQLADAGYPGAVAFNVAVPVTELGAGDHTIDIYVKAVDGTEFKVVKDRSTEQEQIFNQVGVTFTITSAVVAEDAKVIKCNVDSWNFDGESLSTHGWAGANYPATALGYRVDGGEAVFSSVNFTDMNPVEIDIIKGMAGEYAFRFRGTIALQGLSEGEHTVELLVKVDDGKETVLTLHSDKVTVKGADAPADPAARTNTFVDSQSFTDNKLSVAGWTGANYPITEFGYTVDGGEPIWSGVTLTELGADDPVKLPGNAGPNGVRFAINGLDLSDLAAGEHRIQIVMKVADENNTVLDVLDEIITVNVVAAEEPFSVKTVSYDELKYDGTTLFSESVYKKLAELEDKSILDFEEGAVKVITVRGWADVSDSTGDITGYGYSIDGGEIVTGSFVQDRPDLAGAGHPGGVGFNVEVPVKGLKAGEHTITVYLFAEDGSQIQLIKVKEGVEYPIGVTFNVTEAAVEPTPTSDIAIVAIAAVGCIAAAGVVIGKKKFSK